MNFEVKDAVKWLEIMREKTEQHMDYLTDLDDKIGDGDHGKNMVRGFNAVIDMINSKKTQQFNTVAEVMKDSAATLMSTVGGASGILYATAFLRIASEFGDKKEVDAITFGRALQRASEGIKQRGNAVSGEKTLIDVWEAVTELFFESNTFPEASLIEKTAYQAMDNTRCQIAKRGKAALYGGKTVGQIDPGAASSYYLFSALAKTFKEHKNE